MGERIHRRAKRSLLLLILLNLVIVAGICVLVRLYIKKTQSVDLISDMDSVEVTPDETQASCDEDTDSTCKEPETAVEASGEDTDNDLDERDCEDNGAKPMFSSWNYKQVQFIFYNTIQDSAYVLGWDEKSKRYKAFYLVTGISSDGKSNIHVYNAKAKL